MATEYTKEEIQKALAENKKPERMSSTYWSKLKRGLVGKCYGSEVSTFFFSVFTDFSFASTP